MDGTSEDSLRYRRALIETLQRDGHLRSARVALALLAVPRELFVPGVPLDEIYRAGEAIVTKRLDGLCVSSASAPEVIALMLEQLDPHPGQRVLEIGAGTGYNAALLAHLVGETGKVVTLDVDEDLVLGAREHLLAAGYDRVTVVQTDGALGYAEEQPYDRIILTASSNDIAPAWREQLARPHGRLAMPLGLRGVQRCVALAAAEEGYLTSRSLRNCSFIPLRGMLSPGSARVQIEGLLSSLKWVWPSGITASLEEVQEGLHLWLAAHEHNLLTLWGAASPGTLCVIDPTHSTLAVIGWANDSAQGGELYVLTPDNPGELAEHVQRLLQDWAAAGRPVDAGVEVRAYPMASAPPPGPGEVAIDQRWTRFVLRWT